MLDVNSVGLPLCQHHHWRNQTHHLGQETVSNPHLQDATPFVQPHPSSLVAEKEILQNNTLLEAP